MMMKATISTRFDGYYLLPLLFSPEMVRAHLDGMKHETRRPTGSGMYGHARAALHEGRKVFGWVRESWYASYDTDEGIVGYDDLPKPSRATCPTASCWYLADEELKPAARQFQPPTRWVPPMHMPFSRHRLFMRIRSIEQERLSSLCETGAVREGVVVLIGRSGTGFVGSAQSLFREIWSSMYGHWCDTDSVWVLRYDRPQQGNVADYISIERAIERDLVA
jgi:hypothetical protein